jgi:hypothetical protein
MFLSCFIMFFMAQMELSVLLSEKSSSHPVDHHFFMVDPMVVLTGDPLTETLSLDDEICR